MKIGFISDIHEDIESLKAAVEILQSENCSAILCLGDITGFVLPFYRFITTRDAEACVRFVMQNCAHATVGNHDLYTVKKIPHHPAGFDYGSDWYSLDYNKRAKRARNKIWLYEDNELPCHISKEPADFLAALPETKFVAFDGEPFLISHFCHPDFSGSSIHFPAEGFHLKNHFSFAQQGGARLSFSGHGHPEGALIGTMERITNIGFGTYSLTKEPQWIVVPGTAKTNRKNGVLIFDTAEVTIKVIPLSR